MSTISKLKREALRLEAERNGDDLPTVACIEGPDALEELWTERHPGVPYPGDSDAQAALGITHLIWVRS